MITASPLELEFVQRRRGGVNTGGAIHDVRLAVRVVVVQVRFDNALQLLKLRHVCLQVLGHRITPLGRTGVESSEVK